LYFSYTRFVYRFIGLYRVPLVTLNECFEVQSTEGNMEFGGGGSYTWDFEIWKEGSRNGASLCVDSMKGTLREGSFTGDCKRYVKQGSEMGVCFHRVPACQEDGGALLS
jgi:hypothetical protein